MIRRRRALFVGSSLTNRMIALIHIVLAYKYIYLDMDMDKVDICAIPDGTKALGTGLTDLFSMLETIWHSTHASHSPWRRDVRDTKIIEPISYKASQSVVFQTQIMSAKNINSALMHIYIMIIAVRSPVCWSNAMRIKNIIVYRAIFIASSLAYKNTSHKTWLLITRRLSE